MIKRGNERGVALVAAIFLLVVLAALGAVMVSLSGTSHYTVLYALQGAKAYHAARSGIEWGIKRAVDDGACPGVGVPASSTFTVNTADIAFSVTVTCSQSSHTEKSDTYNVYDLTATAETLGAALGSPDYAARRVTATVTDAP